MPLILGKDGINRKSKDVYMGVGGTNKKINEAYIGQGGVNRQVYIEQKEIIIPEETKTSSAPPETSIHPINLNGLKYIKSGGLGVGSKNGAYMGTGRIVFYDNVGNYIEYSQQTLESEYENYSCSSISYNGVDSISLGNRYYLFEIDLVQKVVRILNNYGSVDSMNSIASWNISNFNITNMIRTMTVRPFRFYQTIIKNYI